MCNSTNYYFIHYILQMEDEIVTLLIKDQNSYKKRSESPSKRIKQKFPAHRLAVKHTLPKQLQHRVKRIDLNYNLYPWRCNLLKGINNRNAIKQQRAKNIPDIFYISEIDLQNRKDESHTDYKHQQYRHWDKE